MIAEHIGARSDQGPVRSTNQDAYWVSDASDPLDFGELFIVTDGVGGQEFGAAAAQLAAQTISTSFYHLRQNGESIPEALNQAIHQANEAIYNQAQERGGIKMGCTVVVAVWHQKTLYIAHVGDARVYLLHKNDLGQLTRDDSWVQQQIDAGIITADEAANHEFRNVVTQALGNKLEITVHQSQHDDIHRRDRLLLCTDGLHGVLNDAELTRLLKIDAPQSAAETLVQEAIDAGTEDNVTAVVVQLQTEAGAVAAPMAAGGRRSVPVWVLVTLVVLALLALAWGVYAFWPATTPSESTIIDTLPTIAATALSPTQPAATDPPLSATAVAPTEIPTEPPTDVPPTDVPPTEEPTPTGEPTQTPPTEEPQTTLPASLPPLRGRINEYGFVWTDENIQANDCNQNTNIDISEGTIVRIVEESPITAQPDSTCVSTEFIKIQTENGPVITGWVLDRIVDRLQPDN
jgi:serine/threonine protein phosphatase PrpC